MTQRKKPKAPPSPKPFPAEVLARFGDADVRRLDDIARQTPGTHAAHGLATHPEALSFALGVCLRVLERGHIAGYTPPYVPRLQDIMDDWRAEEAQRVARKVRRDERAAMKQPPADATA